MPRGEEADDPEPNGLGDPLSGGVRPRGRQSGALLTESGQEGAEEDGSKRAKRVRFATPLVLEPNCIWTRAGVLRPTLVVALPNRGNVQAGLQPPCLANGSMVTGETKEKHRIENNWQRI